MKYKNIFLFAIPSTLNTGHFNQYFIDNSENLYLFMMPLSHHPAEVTLTHYHRGQKKSDKKLYWYRGKINGFRPFVYYIYYAYCMLFLVPYGTITMPTSPLFCIGNSMFRFLKGTKTVYHVGDHYPNPQGIMKLFNWLARYYNRHLQYVLYPSSVIQDMYAEPAMPKNFYRDYWVFGIENKPITRHPDKNLFGYVGVLRPGQGIELIFDALEQSPSLRLEIMGDGAYATALKEMVVKKRIQKQVSFLGLIQEEGDIIKTVSRWTAGLAPYEPSTSNMTYYAEPSKIKFYLEYRLPVIMTRVTYIADQIKTYKAGEIVKYHADAIKSAMMQMDPNTYAAGVDTLRNMYEYISYYDQKFKFMTEL